MLGVTELPLGSSDYLLSEAQGRTLNAGAVFAFLNEQKLVNRFIFGLPVFAKDWTVRANHFRRLQPLPPAAALLMGQLIGAEQSGAIPDGTAVLQVTRR